MLDLASIEKHYAQISDDELMRIVTTSAEGIRPEVFTIIEKELKKRNLDAGLLNSAKLQNKEFTNDELEVYASLFRNQPCPGCGSNHVKLNGTKTETVMSVFLLTIFRETFLIGCPTCLNKELNSAIWITALTGWLGITRGFFKTPGVLYRNSKCKKQIHGADSTDSFRAFLRDNIGLIETYKNDPVKMNEMLRSRHRY